MLVDKMLVDKMLVDTIFSDKMLMDKMLSDKMLSNKMTCCQRTVFIILVRNAANILPVKAGEERWDCMTRGSLTLYYIYLFLNMLIASPENHISTGVHQGPMS